MKWIIKNPAPTDSRQEKWGDFHFGRSLTKYLERKGHEVTSDYYPDWYHKEKSDIVLVLRGKYPYEPQGDAFHIMWNISHPADVSLSEYEKYDLIFIASEKHANNIRSKLNKPVYPLIQCTDHEEFGIFEDKENDHRSNIIFVGNTKSIKRPGIIWATEMGLPLKVWGRGWDKWIDEEYVVDEYIDNKELGRLYSRSKAILNDHYEDMRTYGFINNRIFDALSCGLPIISDFHEELFKLFPEEILYYSNKEELNDAIKQLLFSYPNIKRKVNKNAKVIKDKHSFQTRVETILQTLDEEYH